MDRTVCLGTSVTHPLRGGCLDNTLGTKIDSKVDCLWQNLDRLPRYLHRCLLEPEVLHYVYGLMVRDIFQEACRTAKHLHHTIRVPLQSLHAFCLDPGASRTLETSGQPGNKFPRFLSIHRPSHRHRHYHCPGARWSWAAAGGGHRIEFFSSHAHFLADHPLDSHCAWRNICPC